jgi:hypothetical protein
MTFLIVMVWLMALFSGGVLAIGLITLLIGRVPFIRGSSAWTRREARQLGAVWTVVGAIYATYALLGGIVLGLQLETHGSNPLIGRWWGFFVPMVPGLVLVVGLLVQLELYKRHERRARDGRPR